MNARKSDGFPQVNDPPAPPVEMMYLMPALAQALTFALMKAETWYEPQASDVHDPPAKAHVTVVIPVPASADSRFVCDPVIDVLMAFVFAS